MRELALDFSCKEKSQGFQSVKVIDTRSQNQFLGTVQNGAFNTSTEIVCMGLTDSLAAYFTGSTLNTPLVITLNEFFVNELRGSTSEIGRFRLAARFFTANAPDQYNELITIDTIYTTKGGDVTKKLLRSVSEQFCVLAQQVTSLARQKTLSDTATYSYQDLLTLDSLEKMKLPMYRDNQPKAGIYRNFRQFVMNEPEPAVELTIEERKNMTLVYALNEKRKKKVKLLPEGLFAVSDGTILLRATGLGFYKMVKKGSDFYYWRPRQSYSSSVPVPLMGMGYGAVGGLIAGAMQAASKEDNRWLLQKVNHRRGNSVPVSWVNGKPK
ncbi:hypothetical protein Slin_5992 [Spirosoma linguale DSM 74]|uniref:Uncharacterized protein n=2 Tax=Spirosoma TaxID=107 RepID=D2QT22_SPILD|nr:hypothetical protein Slin_5992 [Spirosoma linguale DSM 74]